MENHILWLNKTEVESLLDMKEVIDVVEETFRQHGLKKVQMPPKCYLDFKKHNGDLRTMPAYLEEQDIAGVKIVTVYKDNPGKGLPTVMALVILNSTETGAPIAVMDGTYLTDMRTGAAGGIAVKYMARSNAKTVGFIGAGNQAKTQLLAINQIIDIDEVRVYDTQESRMLAFIYEMKELIYCKNIHESTDKKACDCDILVTTTPVKKPIVMNEWIKEGIHVNAIGADAPGKEELDPLILQRANIVVDDMVQTLHSGEINVPISEGLISETKIIGELGELILGIKKARTNDADITVFDSTGLAILDIAVGNFVYQKALKRNMGVIFKL